MSGLGGACARVFACMCTCVCVLVCVCACVCVCLCVHACLSIGIKKAVLSVAMECHEDLC